MHLLEVLKDKYTKELHKPNSTIKVLIHKFTNTYLADIGNKASPQNHTIHMQQNIGTTTRQPKTKKHLKYSNNSTNYKSNARHLLATNYSRTKSNEENTKCFLATNYSRTKSNEENTKYFLATNYSRIKSNEPTTIHNTTTN